MFSLLTGSSLSEAVDDEEQALLSAADWVKRSRKKELIPIIPKTDTKKDISSSSYDATALKGLQVKHDAEDFELGEEMILTLADAPLLQRDTNTHKIIGLASDHRKSSHTNGDAEDEDILENINLAENDKRNDRIKQLKRLKQPIYTAYDDNEFSESGYMNTNNNLDESNGQHITKKRRSILSQYDADEKVMLLNSHYLLIIQ